MNSGPRRLAKIIFYRYIVQGLPLYYTEKGPFYRYIIQGLPLYYTDLPLYYTGFSL